MTDLARLREALAADEEFDGNISQEHYDAIRDAARAYRDLMENGERQWLCIERSPIRAMGISNMPGGPTHCYFTSTGVHLPGCGWVRLVSDPKASP